MTADSSRTLQVTRHFDASSQRVFDAWIDPATAGKWLFATPTGQMVRVEIDVVPQGAGCELTLTHDNVLPEWRERTQAGWGKLLGNLAARLATPAGE
jgi:activator of Hsp90 ATPase-like protein